MREGFETDDLAIRKMNATTLLASSQDMVDEYIRVSNNLGNSEELATQLNKTVVELKGKIADSKSAIQTYEQEFMERKEAIPVQPALKTLQDYVLVFFFISYLLVSIFISLYVGRSLRSTATSIIALLIMFAMGVVISQVLLKFG
jgi:predicted transcriptional regulator